MGSLTNKMDQGENKISELEDRVRKLEQPNKDKAKKEGTSGIPSYTWYWPSEKTKLGDHIHKKI